jgi:hypothetical protein
VIGTHLTVNGTYYFWRDDTYVVTTAEYLNVFVRWRSGTAPRFDTLGDRGDVRSTTVYDTVLTGSINYAAGEPITFNTTEADTNNYSADYSQGMVWNRFLTDAEIQALIADPYGWYSPRRETVGVSSPYPLLVGDSFMRTISSG